MAGRRGAERRREIDVRHAQVERGDGVQRAGRQQVERPVVERLRQVVPVGRASARSSVAGSVEATLTTITRSAPASLLKVAQIGLQPADRVAGRFSLRNRASPGRPGRRSSGRSWRACRGGCGRRSASSSGRQASIKLGVQHAAVGPQPLGATRRASRRGFRGRRRRTCPSRRNRGRRTAAAR